MNRNYRHKEHGQEKAGAKPRKWRESSENKRKGCSGCRSWQGWDIPAISAGFSRTRLPDTSLIWDSPSLSVLYFCPCSPVVMAWLVPPPALFWMPYVYLHNLKFQVWSDEFAIHQSHWIFFCTKCLWHCHRDLRFPNPDESLRSSYTTWREQVGRAVGDGQVWKMG